MSDPTPSTKSSRRAGVARPTKPSTDAPRQGDFLPGVPTRRVLFEAGILVPASATITGDLRTRGEVSIDTDVLPLAPHVKTHTHLGVVYLRVGNGISGKLMCSCEGNGGGACDTLTTEDDLGNPGVSCVSENCKGHCKMFAKVPGTNLAVLALRAAGVDVPPDIHVLGDMATDASFLITANEVRLSEHTEAKLVEGVDGQVLMIRNGKVVAGFDCTCKKAGGGSCTASVDDVSLVCQRDTCRQCQLVVTFPSQQLAPDSRD